MPLSYDENMDDNNITITATKKITKTVPVRRTKKKMKKNKKNKKLS